MNNLVSIVFKKRIENNSGSIQLNLIDSNDNPLPNGNYIISIVQGEVLKKKINIDIVSNILVIFIGILPLLVPIYFFAYGPIKTLLSGGTSNYDVSISANTSGSLWLIVISILMLLLSGTLIKFGIRGLKKEMKGDK
jgi:hypothetical protein